MLATTTNIWIRIAALLLLVVTPTIGLALYTTANERNQELHRIRAEAQGIARVVAGAQAQELEQARAQLQHVVRSGVPLAGQACDARLRELLALGSVHFPMTVIDPQGRVTCASRPFAPDLQLGDRSYFRQAIATRAFSLSEPLLSRVSNSLVLVAALPVMTDNTIVAVIAAGIQFNWAQNLLEKLRLPDNAVVSMTYRDGRILARAPLADQFVGKFLLEAQAFENVVTDQPEGFVESAGLDGTPRIIAYTQVSGAPLYVRVGIPRELIDAAVATSVRAGVLTLIATISVMGLIGWLGSRNLVVRPLRQLFDAADRLGRGDWSIRTGMSHENHVVGPLAHKLDELAGYGQRMTRAFRTLSAGNRTLLREREEPRLLQEMCRVAVEQGGYVLAFVAYRDRDSARSVHPVASHGDSRGFLELLNVTWGEGERGQGTVGTAIRTNAPSAFRSIATDPRFAPWRQAALERGYGSLISLPLNVDHHTIGVFTLIAAEEDAFDAQEVALLQEMADDLSFGIQMARDAVRRREAERVAEHALTHDSLTGLPNRILFLQRLSTNIAGGAPQGSVTIILTIYLPHLQEVYDGFGYMLGNAVVREISARLRGIEGIEGVLARLSVNEFGIFLHAGTADAADSLVEALHGAFHEPVRIDGTLIDITAAIGASLHPDHGGEADDLLRRAAIAARAGANRDVAYSVYQGATEQENPERLTLAAELRMAIANGGLDLHFQPKIDLRTGMACGSEALIRWQHPTRGFLPPAKFVQLAEETGLIRPMTDFVISAAIRQQHLWGKRAQALPVAVNLSVKNLYDPKFIEKFQAQLEAWAVPAHLVEIEITESTLAHDPEAARDVLVRLRQLGTKIYIDDFGTGYSSLNYLVTLPVHALKIDRSFVQRMTGSDEAQSIVRSIVSMAHNLGLRVVAEGVETPEELALLTALGCDEAQGYLFSRPVAEADFGSRYLPIR